MEIRPLDPVHDLDLVSGFYRDAPDYWQMAEGRAPGCDKARDFFTDTPPGCDAQASHRLGLFLDRRLSGVAELSFGFPNPGDAYLGFMMLGPWARGKGHGRVFLAHVEALTRARLADQLFLAVLQVNTRGQDFWKREGFTATGLSGDMVMGDLQHHVYRFVKPL